MTTTVSPGGTVDAARFERACEWFIELRERSQSPEVVAEWLAWCRADPLNREAFEQARAVWQVTADARAEDLALPLRAASRSKTARARTRRRAAIVAGALAASVAAAALYLLPGSLLRLTPDSQATVFATKPGENRTVRLPDGSTLALGAGSRLLTQFDEESRRLTLEQGEAYFKVKRDRTRPFVVTVGNYRVTAVGTAFNVRAGSDRVVIAVAEGMVAIEPPAVSGTDESGGRGSEENPHGPSIVLRDTLRAGAGQAVVLDITEQQLQVVRVEPKAVAGWQTGRLEFTREPLRSVLSSVNRYSMRPVKLDDPALGELRFTGTVFADRVDDWLRGLPEIYPVNVREAGASVVIESRGLDARAELPAR